MAYGMVRSSHVPNMQRSQQPAEEYSTRCIHTSVWSLSQTDIDASFLAMYFRYPRASAISCILPAVAFCQYCKMAWAKGLFSSRRQRQHLLHEGIKGSQDWQQRKHNQDRGAEGVDGGWSGVSTLGSCDEMRRIFVGYVCCGVLRVPLRRKISW